MKIPTFKIEDLKRETIKNIGKEEDQFLGLYLIGSIQTLTPSGKIYAPWTTNQTQDDIDKDQEFWEALEKSLPENYFIHHYEDSVFIAREIDIDTEDLYSAIFVDSDTRDQFIEAHGLREVSEKDLEDSFEEMIDDCYPNYNMGSLTFLPSRILKSDPVAFREAFLEYLNSELENEILIDIGGEYFYR